MNSRQELVEVWSKAASTFNAQLEGPFDSQSLKIGIKMYTPYGIVTVKGIDQWGSGVNEPSIIQTQFEVAFSSFPPFDLTLEENRS
ncbi:hypothetical protein [Nafulsella turpanensis]|uniref:hypothetical protein n=1 Tax=Nafulsella turpanensis TaxID=1265690 RepID=UPI00034B41A9|nr:hypothetical protein [Nafulsella turpanensis]